MAGFHWVSPCPRWFELSTETDEATGEATFTMTTLRKNSDYVQYYSLVSEHGFRADVTRPPTFAYVLCIMFLIILRRSAAAS